MDYVSQHLTHARQRFATFHNVSQRLTHARLRFTTFHIFFTTFHNERLFDSLTPHVDEQLEKVLGRVVRRAARWPAAPRNPATHVGLFRLGLCATHALITGVGRLLTSISLVRGDDGLELLADLRGGREEGGREEGRRKGGGRGGEWRRGRAWGEDWREGWREGWRDATLCCPALTLTLTLTLTLPLPLPLTLTLTLTLTPTLTLTLTLALTQARSLPLPLTPNSSPNR